MTGSRSYPPATNHQRPTERKFWIWEDTSITYTPYEQKRYGWGRHPWRWCCTHCEPPASGFRVKAGAYQRIINTAMPQHFRNLQYHHQWAKNKPVGMKGKRT